MVKKIIICLLFLNLISCNTLQDKYYETLKGEWQITKFYHKKVNIMEAEDYTLLGFEKHNKFWLTKFDDTKEFTSSDYKLLDNRDNLKIDIKNCEDIRFNGKYKLYIDTIQNTKEQYIIQITLDSENTFIQAIKPKLKDLFAVDDN